MRKASRKSTLKAAIPAIIAAAIPATFRATAVAESYQWTPTNGGTFNWNNASSQDNWDPGDGDTAYPSAATDDADLVLDLLGNQTVSLNENISIRNIVMGDSNATHTFTFQSGAATSTLSFSTLTISSGQVTFNSAIGGNGTLVKLSTNSLTFNNPNTGFTGTLDLRAGSTVFNNAAARLAAVSTINVRSTALLDIGASTYTAGLPRVNPSATVNFHAGRFFYGGTFAAGVVEESGPTLNFATGTGTFDFRPGSATTRQVELTLTAMTREVGAVGQLRADTLGGVDLTVGVAHRLLLGTAPTLVGGGGAASSATASIIPWMIGGAGSAITSNQPRDFLTYTANGIEVAGNGTTNVNPTNPTDNVTHGTSGTLSLNANRTFNSLKFTNSGTVAIGTNQLTITSGAIIMGGTGSSITAGVGGRLNFGAAEGIVYAVGSNVNTISAPINGTGGLTKGSTGTLILSGDNLFTGDTHVAGGVLRMGIIDALDAGSNVYLANSNVNVLSPGSYPTITSWDLGGFNQTIAGLGGGGELGGHTDLRAATLTIGKVAPTTTTYSGVIAGSGGIVKTGSNTQVFAGNNTYGGSTAVNGGTLRAASGHAFGDSASAVNVNAGGTVDLGGRTQVAGKSFVLAGGSLINSDVASTVTIGTGASVSVTNGGSYTGVGTTPTVTIGNPTTGTTAVGTALMGLTGLTVENAGVGYTGAPTVVFSAPDVAGGTAAFATVTVSNGTISSVNLVSSGSGYTSIPTVTLSTSGSTTAAVLTPVASIHGVLLSDGGSGYTSAPSVTFSSGTSTATGAGGFGSVNVTAQSNIGGAGNLTINPVISGAGGLTKIGTGTTTLANANTYAGPTTVSAGRLVVSNVTGSATGTGNVRVETAANIGGNGSVSGALAVDGSITPGTSVGTISSGDLTINGTYAAEADFTSNTGDQIKVTGGVTLGASSVLDLSALNIAGAGPLNPSLTLVLIDNDNEDDAVQGTFNTINPGEIAGIFEYDVVYNYNATMSSFGDGNDVAVTFTAVPEPGSLALAGLGALSLLRRRRRRA